MPIDHVKLPVSDLDASRAFYRAALEPFGYKLVYDEQPSLSFGTRDGGDDNEPFAFSATARRTSAVMSRSPRPAPLR